MSAWLQSSESMTSIMAHSQCRGQEVSVPYQMDFSTECLHNMGTGFPQREWSERESEMDTTVSEAHTGIATVSN